MKIKLIPTRYEHHGKIVTCKLECHLQIPEKLLGLISEEIMSEHKMHIFQEVNKRGNVITYLVIKAKGIAKCHPEDIYDMEIGERIAESRATLKVLARVTSTLEYSMKKINNLHSAIEEQLNKSNHILKKEITHLRKLEEGK